MALQLYSYINISVCLHKIVRINDLNQKLE